MKTCNLSVVAALHSHMPGWLEAAAHNPVEIHTEEAAAAAAVVAVVVVVVTADSGRS